MNYHRFMIGGFLVVFALCASDAALMAQDQPQQDQSQQDQDSQSQDAGQPKPAAKSYFPVVDPNQPDNQDNNMQPDYTPLTGVQNATLGTPGIRHSYFVPGLQYGSMVWSEPSFQSNASNWYAENYFLGNVSLLKVWSSSELAVNYTGGGFVSSGDTAAGIPSGFQAYQQLRLAQTFRTARWLVQVLDSFAYLPQSEFGFGAGTNIGVAGVGSGWGAPIGGLSNIVTPNQSIFSTTGPYYNNTAVIQATYSLSPRSSITVAGAYGILNFVNAGNINTDTAFGSAGYNYILSPRDTIGVVYWFSSDHFQGYDQAFGSHTVGLAYSHKITGRLAASASGGPQFTFFRVPIGTTTQETGFNINGNLTYSTLGGSLTGSFIHSLSGGSGVLIGSNLNQLNTTFTHRLGRVWSGNLNFGYAHNAGLSSLGQFSSGTYSDWFAGGGVSRPIGRSIYVGVSYDAYISGQNYAGCVGSGCGTYTNNSINISVQWHSRPFAID